MASIQFRTGSAATNGLQAQIVVDGADITRHVMADGFSIGPSRPGDPNSEWVVRMTLVARPIDVDLPEAVIEATRSDGAAA